ncbi:tRNA (adenosine(37)-N6)-threonylcarbamoyltransferase complex ATPase subunit type 1 TsaE [Arthrobacter sp. H14-L1]|uniref:tRNA (adenosine(37)-N6)-threonylcarbamoyltransferase complex ATPase subunit type 1 TsaE n=1 Tax=Arthrobacter sp. H14-L1 TaxID=2996697 RepID=UPI00226ECD8E|nr:tRNA (adenosine(37)-N6)-threonylcarbamoyltransferase complex ATPase subunit type 1 TsaE [Arthrobacter sp. H14-L1]MCY0904427.1 tRNA (adenosine(37)-N6)-threonylcarbamoyltransferase complex ATPase subunit type 1 TsaE [Arthrobacter sp. H14-L1]
MTAGWEFQTAAAEETQVIAERLGGMLQAGDLLILSGGLGAGKTTFTQGLGRGLGVRSGIISPTFVLVRIHPNLPDGPRPGGPDLVHVDAYRLGSSGEVDDIDLENTLDSAVTVVEWGAGLAEHLAESRLEVELVRAVGAAHAGLEDGAEARLLRVTAVGPRWGGVDLSGLPCAADPASSDTEPMD